MSKFSGLGARLHSGETSIDYIGKRRRWYAVSGLLVIASIAALSLQGLHLGIEFKGGSSYTITKSGGTIAQAESALTSAGITGEKIIQHALASTFGVSVEAIDTQIIGPSWGKEITRKALYGLVGFLVVVILYLAMAFEPKMALSAIVAVVHDVFITVGIYALVGFDVTPATVIGFLTILGYSLYDTVVVFDRVRENTRSITSTSKMTYSQAANLAINQTVIRSINTTIVALLPVGSILFVGAGLLGAGTLKDLSLALFIGLATGAYSSIFIATPLLAAMREREPAMKALAKRINARGGSTVVATVGSSASEANNEKRGPRNQPPRNQPKRKGRK